VVDIDLGDSLSGSFDSFFSFLPNLIGATIIFAVGMVFVVVPAILWRRSGHRLRARNGPLFFVVRFIVVLFLFMLTLVVVSLTINTLGFEKLTDSFNRIIEFVPVVIVTGLLLGMSWMAVVELLKFRGVSDVDGNGASAQWNVLGTLVIGVVAVVGSATAMAVLFGGHLLGLAVAVFVAVGIVATAAATLRDDKVPLPPPPTRQSDEVAPGERSS